MMKVCLSEFLSKTQNLDLHRPSVVGTQSLGRALRLLQIVVTRPHQGWRISDIAQKSELDITTVHRLLTALVQENLVEQRRSDKHYLPGSRLFELSLARSEQHEFQRDVENILRKFAQKCVGTLLFLVRSDTDFVCSMHLNLSGKVSTTMLYPGARRSMINSAGGIVILQNLPEPEFMRVLKDNLVREQVKNGQSRFGALQQAFDVSNEYGFGVNLGFLVSGSHAFALVVSDASNEVYGSVCLIGAAEDYPESSIMQTRDFLIPIRDELQSALQNRVFSVLGE
ncbi:IclR family transcriptional regulator [Orrella sp. 11846]|uniref:IclR family transcriptional regulator n=1 Tax=Orrella sp. 11846 TaxID=3409913 RepID=UPI003B58D3CD